MYKGTYLSWKFLNVSHLSNELSVVHLVVLGSHYNITNTVHSALCRTRHYYWLCPPLLQHRTHAVIPIRYTTFQMITQHYSHHYCTDRTPLQHSTNKHWDKATGMLNTIALQHSHTSRYSYCAISMYRLKLCLIH